LLAIGALHALVVADQDWRQPGCLGILRGVTDDALKKRGSVAFRPYLSIGLAVSPITYTLFSDRGDTYFGSCILAAAATSLGI
jgi:hypothetical protein